MTVVATRTRTSPARNRCMTASLSRESIRPWMTATSWSGISLRNAAAVASTSEASIASLASTSGQTT